MAKTFYLGAAEVIPDFIEPIKDKDLVYEDIIPFFGSNNLFPEEITTLARQSAYYRGVINSKVSYCGGVSFDANDQLLELVDGMNLHTSYKNLLSDDFMVGNSYVEIVTDAKKSFLKIFHRDVTEPRVAKEGEALILNPDWRNRDTTKDVVIPLYPNFRKMGDGLMHSLVHIKSYEAGFKFYGVPDNYAAMKSTIIDSQADRWNKERLENSFSSDGILIIPNVDNADDAKKIKRDLDNKTGAKNAGKVLPIFEKPLGSGETRQRPEFISLRDEDDGSWMGIDKLSSEKILIANSWYASLAAFPQQTGFDTERIINDYKIAKLNVIDPIQDFWLGMFKRIFADFGIDADDLRLVNKAPVEEVDKEVLTINERRELMGLEEIENGNTILNVNKSNTGNQSGV